MFGRCLTGSLVLHLALLAGLIYWLPRELPAVVEPHYFELSADPGPAEVTAGPPPRLGSGGARGRGDAAPGGGHGPAGSQRGPQPEGSRPGRPKAAAAAAPAKPAGTSRPVTNAPQAAAATVPEKPAGETAMAQAVPEQPVATPLPSKPKAPAHPAAEPAAASPEAKPKPAPKNAAALTEAAAPAAAPAAAIHEPAQPLSVPQTPEAVGPALQPNPALPRLRKLWGAERRQPISLSERRAEQPPKTDPVRPGLRTVIPRAGRGQPAAWDEAPGRVTVPEAV